MCGAYVYKHHQNKCTIVLYENGFYSYSRDTVQPIAPLCRREICGTWELSGKNLYFNMGNYNGQESELFLRKTENKRMNNDSVLVKIIFSDSEFPHKEGFLFECYKSDTLICFLETNKDGEIRVPQNCKIRSVDILYPRFPEFLEITESHYDYELFAKDCKCYYLGDYHAVHKNKTIILYKYYHFPEYKRGIATGKILNYKIKEKYQKTRKSKMQPLLHDFK